VEHDAVAKQTHWRQCRRDNVALQQIEEGSLERYVPNLERNYSGGGWHP
jgi:hypothetical protein